MKILKLIVLVAIAICPSLAEAQTTLPVVDTISVAGDPIATTIGGVMASSTVIPTNADSTLNNDPAIYDVGAENVGVVSSDPALLADPVVPTIFYNYGIRERANLAQTTRRIRSFLQFDVSTIPAAELADPNFTATFTVDYVGNLNILNTGLDVGLGQVVDGAWDSTTTIPTVAFSDNSTELGLLIENAAANAAPISGLTVDITSLVQGWADGSISNFGLTFNVPAVPISMGNRSNSAYFTNATIVTGTGASFAVGDVNCDGAINFLDISPFISAIASGVFEDKADINRDGVVNFLDIQGFIALL